MKKPRSKGVQPEKIQSSKGKFSQKQQKEQSYFALISLGAVILLGIICYSNSFDCSFHFDDARSIVDNAKIREMDVNTIWTYSHNRFIPYLTFAINYKYGALNVWGYHLVNLIIHLITSCLVYWLTVVLFSTPAIKGNATAKHKNAIALFTALLFVSHPLATQSVTYIVQRMASMVALFYLLSVMLYIQARLTESGSKSKYLLFGGALISLVLALLTKENAYTLPFAIVLIELCFFQTKKFTINFKDYRLYLITVALVGFVFVIVQKLRTGIFKSLPASIGTDFEVITPLNYLLTQFSVIPKYLQLLLLPVNQNLEHDFPIISGFFETRTLAGFLFLVSIIALAFILFNKNRIIAFGILWFFLTLAIESSIIPIEDVIFEHRTYLPSFGFFLSLSMGIYVLLFDKNESVVVAILVMIISVNAYLTYQRNKVWKDPISLWSDVVLKSPHKARAFNNLGYLLMNENKYDEALVNFNSAITLQPLYAEAYNNRGSLLRNTDQYDAMLRDFNTAIKLDSNNVDALNNRGNVYMQQIRYEFALNDFNKAIELQPEMAESYNNRGTVYLKEKKFMEAGNDFKKAITLLPEFAMAYANLGITKFNSGIKDSACFDFQKAAQLGFVPANDLLKQYCK